MIEIFKSTVKYSKYILRHKKYVFAECFYYGILLRGLVHDLSKILPSEFVAYRDYFYSDKSESDKAPFEVAFDLAWLKHQKRNDHHWQYWLLLSDDGGLTPKEMPLDARKEMLADWIGMAKARSSSVSTWYRENKDKIVMAPETRSWIEREIRTRFGEVGAGGFLKVAAR